MRHYDENSVRWKFHTAKNPYGENSVRRNFCTAKILTAKIPYGKNSVKRKIYTAINPTDKIPTAKIPATSLIYRHQNIPITDFTQFVTNTLDQAYRCRTVFAGDLNVDVISNSNAMRNHVDTFHQYGLINKIVFPIYVTPITRIDTSSIETLNQNLNCTRRSLFVFPALLDHYPIHVKFRANHNNPPKSISFRDFSETNAKLLASKIDIEFFRCSLPQLNPSKMIDYLVFFLNNE